MTSELRVIGIEPPSPPLCKNCKWAQPDKFWFRAAIIDVLLIFGIYRAKRDWGQAWRWARCSNPKSHYFQAKMEELNKYKKSLVDGGEIEKQKESDIYLHCSTARREDFLFLRECGTEGKFFEPREKK